MASRFKRERIMPVNRIIDMALANSKYNTKKSKVNKKWVKFLKRKKLFDEYMIYLAGHNSIGVEPRTYRELSNICYNMMGVYYITNKAHLNVNWVKLFEEFLNENLKWYNIKEIILYLYHNKYK